MPENLDLGGNPFPDPIALLFRQGRAEHRQLLTDAVLVIEDAAANRLGGMRGQHGADFELIENPGDLLRRYAVLHAAGK
jgi:hypothetical protein